MKSKPPSGQPGFQISWPWRSIPRQGRFPHRAQAWPKPSATPPVKRGLVQTSSNADQFRSITKECAWVRTTQPVKPPLSHDGCDFSDDWLSHEPQNDSATCLTTGDLQAPAADAGGLCK